MKHGKTQAIDCLAGKRAMPIPLWWRGWICLCLQLASLLTGRAQSDISDTSNLLQTDWAAQTGWNTSQDMCMWPGISCSQGRAIAIELEIDDVTGSLPDTWGYLAQLNTLVLSGQSLTGSLPESWSTLAALRTLDLSVNQLNGTLPSMWSALSQVQLVDVHNNSLTGLLPTAWSNLSQIAYLNLQDNGFTGPLPETYSNLTQISQLLLQGNQINSTCLQLACLHAANAANLLQVPWAAQAGWNTSVGICKWPGITCTEGQVTIIDLVDTNLTGSLPESWSSLSHLEELLLSYNGLTGTLPESYSNLSHLTSLDLSYNVVTGSLPTAWSQMSQLGSLDLSNNAISGSLPSQWSRLPLEELLLSYNGLTGTLPESYSNLSHLTSLDLSYNVVTGSLPTAWSQMSQLTNLDLNHNVIMGSLPTAWSQMSQLGELDVASNFLSGTLPPSFANLTQLIFLDLSMNNLTGTLPESWGQLPQLQDLALSCNLFTGTLPSAWRTVTQGPGAEQYGRRLDHNRLTGTLPASWGSVQILSLDLRNNRFTGALPDSWVNMNLLKLDLQQNELTGTLPEDWGKHGGGYLAFQDNKLHGTLPTSWSKLDVLYMSFDNNNFTGSLPRSWSNWSEVAYLSMENNSLEGLLPESWASMAGLGWLGLAFNDLTGMLPVSWSNMSQLRYLSLRNNRLTATLPSSWMNMTKLEYMSVEDNLLRGSLPPEWSTMSRLLFGGLSSNAFEGSIPSSWGSNWTQVQVLRVDSNHLTGTIPQLGNITLLNATSNSLSDLSLTSLPASLKVAYLANNSLNGTLPRPDQLPVNLTALDVSNNFLHGTLPQALPFNLTVFNASNNLLTGALPHDWHRLAELRLDDMKLTGQLPVEWHTWGSNTSNSIQLSMINNQLHGHMPQQWVQQFCLAVVQDSVEQTLFDPTVIDIELLLGDVAHGDVDPELLVPVGSPITLVSQHASINVTLGNQLYTFSYQDPNSICSIPDAVRNAALLWGTFAVLLLATIVGMHCWLRRKKSFATPWALSKITVLSSAMRTTNVKLSKRVVTSLWVFFSDVVWFVYSQVTDAVTIHQVFSSGHRGYAFILLAILLLPYLLLFFLIMTVCVRYCQSMVSGASQGRLRGWLCSIAAAVAGVVLSPFIFLACEFGMLVEATGIPAARWFLPASPELSTLYRFKSIAEAFFNALPQAIIQTKLYVMGNDPNGIHVYIDTALFIASAFGSLASVLKTVALMIFEVHQEGHGMFVYLKRLVVLVSVDKPGQPLQNQISISGTSP
ncbi:hypothetical protein ABBQ38_011503 [Trebouxia sp. C0009 RCD-2024]